MTTKRSRSKIVDIHEFPIHKMPLNSKIVVIGKPATGKSVLIRHITKILSGHIPVGKIFFGQETSFYKDMVPDLYIYNEYNEEEMEKFAKRQRIMIQEHPEDSAHPEYANALLVLDDVSDDPKFFNRPLFQKFFKNGRHWRMFLILALQYSKDIRPVIRSTIDYTFIARATDEATRRVLHENYATIIGDYNDFCDAMDQLTDDYTFLVINNRSQSNNMTDCVFYYKAPLHHDSFQFGCEEYKTWAEQRYNKDYKPF